MVLQIIERVTRVIWTIGTRVAFFLFIGVGAAWSAPITFNTALPVAEDEFIFRQQFVFDQSGDDPSGADRDRGAFAAVSVLGYGVTSDLAIFGVLPWPIILSLVMSPGLMLLSSIAFGPAVWEAEFLVSFMVSWKEISSTRIKTGVTVPKTLIPVAPRCF